MNTLKLVSGSIMTSVSRKRAVIFSLALFFGIPVFLLKILLQAKEKDLQVEGLITSVFFRDWGVVFGGVFSLIVDLFKGFITLF